jgi:3-deoxy-D-manno-octulosonate 8-phosphate phosphatase (KDO 8-P phosphatase)
MGVPESTKARQAANVRLLALDVDGVLTDGSIMLDDRGVETKRFNVRDGQGITAWIKMGFEVAIITRRSGLAVQHRCRELGITRIVQGCQDKSAALDQLIAETGIAAELIAYVGDDWPDMPAMRRVGLAIAPADADPRVKELAALVTMKQGGRGAVREAIEHILAAQGLLEKTIALFDPAR